MKKQDTTNNRNEILSKRPLYKYGWQGILHLSLEFLVSFTVIIYCFRQIHQYDHQVLILVPLSLIFGSFCVYMIHRFPFHGNYKIFRLMYHEHSLIHHRFYSKDDFEIEAPRELNKILFDLLAMVVFVGGISIPISLLLNYFVSSSFSYFFMIMAVLYFLLYETFHLIAHLPENNLIAKLPYLRFMRRHHLIHHDWNHMHQKNFNIVFPFFDILFRTFSQRYQY